ncbi:MAG: hypothetical protein QM758_08990 [Armatimonas sp.]
MTWALCHGCGCTKFGAIVPCPECDVASTGNFEMDILFSDHHITHRTIDEFGAVLKAIYAATNDPGFGHFTFLVHVVDNYPDMGLGVGKTSPGLTAARELLATLDLPPVTLEPSRQGLPGPPDDHPPPRRRWWEFWKRGP